ncbi:MAG TPA: RagB/SusD family nutrient uptake outer membrane protein [Gillisia sp.]|nr:RagB/SusD family nutrient uptake outer membrane protein [Gillisia sp.]
MMKKNLKYLLLMVVSMGMFVSCSEEDLDPTIQQSKDIDISVNTTSDLQAILNGAYNRMTSFEYYGRDKIILGEVFSDNTASNANSNRFVVEARMDLLPQTATALTFWARAYTVIGSANIIINAEGITGDQDEIDHIKGQAYVMRALAHFDLVTFYGQQHVNGGGESAVGVPYVTEFRNEDELFPARVSVQQVKENAYADLEMAQSLMSDANTKEFISIYAAYAIEARIANYFGEHPRALEAANFVIDSGLFTVATEENFLASFATKRASNSIFELAFRDVDNEGINGIAMIYNQTNYGDVIALPNLVAIYEEGDVRGASPFTPGTVPSTVIGLMPNGTTYRNVGKYPSIAPYDDNIVVVRIEEMYLIKAEALLGTEEGLDALNMVAGNRGGSEYTEATIANVLLERRKELAFEGFRFHDLARMGMDIPFLDATLQTHGGPAYGSFKFAMPLPAGEVDANANLTQNAGYGA